MALNKTENSVVTWVVLCADNDVLNGFPPRVNTDDHHSSSSSSSSQQQQQQHGDDTVRRAHWTPKTSRHRKKHWHHFITAFLSLLWAITNVNTNSKQKPRLCQLLVIKTLYFFAVAAWLSGNALVSIKVVALRRARLVLGWGTVRGYTILLFNQATRSTQTVHPSLDRRNEYWQVAMVSATAREETASSA